MKKRFLIFFVLICLHSLRTQCMGCFFPKQQFSKSESGEGTIYEAIAQNNFALFNARLDNSQLDSLAGTQKVCALHYTAWYNRLSMCRTLLERGASLDLQALHGNTPLMMACFRGNVAIARALLEKKADANLQTDKGDTALHMALKRENFDIVDLLLSEKYDVDVDKPNNEGEIPIFLLLSSTSGKLKYRDREKYLEKFILCGANMYMNDAKGMPLILMAYFKDCRSPLKKMKYSSEPIRLFSFCQILFNHGYDLEHVDDKGDTILTYTLRGVLCASDDERDSFCTFLFNRGVDVHRRMYLSRDDRDDENHEKVAPILYISMLKNRSPALLYLFIAHGADVNEVNNIGITPLMWAVMSCLVSVELLLDHHADIERQSSEGKTALHFACKYGQFKAYKKLIEAGANIDVRTKSNNRLPLHYACLYGHVKIAKDILKKYLTRKSRGEKIEIEFMDSSRSLLDCLVETLADAGMESYYNVHTKKESFRRDIVTIIKLCVDNGFNIYAQKGASLTPVALANKHINNGENRELHEVIRIFRESGQLHTGTHEIMLDSQQSDDDDNDSVPLLEIKSPSADVSQYDSLKLIQENHQSSSRSSEDNNSASTQELLSE